MYKIATVCVSGATAVAIDLKPIPRGIKGAVVELRYDDSIWAGLRKKVTFRGSAETEDICDENTVTFPAEVAQKKNARVSVGITGVSEDGTVIIPTLWADLGSVRDSAYGNYPAPGEPVPPVWAQLLTMIGDLKNLDTEAKDNLVNAINEAMTKGGSGGSGVYTLAEGESVEDVPPEYDVVVDPYADEDVPLASGVYTLSEGETIEDVPPEYDVVIAPYAEPEIPEADISLNVEGASVGQIVKVAAVDEAGKPTAWEAVEMPSGGGGDVYERKPDIVIEPPENVRTIMITEDDNGNDISADKITVFIDIPAGLDCGTYYHVCYGAKAEDGMTTNQLKSSALMNFNFNKPSGYAENGSQHYFVSKKINDQNYVCESIWGAKKRDGNLDSGTATMQTSIFPNLIEGETKIRTILLTSIADKNYKPGAKISIWLD